MNLSNARNAASACNYNFLHFCLHLREVSLDRNSLPLYSLARLYMYIATIVDCVFLLLPGVIKSEGLLAIFSCATSNWFSTTQFVPLG
jgi:hypothetical protein